MQKVLGVVQELLTIAPETLLAKNSKGHYPLHLALYNQQSYDTLTCLFKAAPKTITMRDEKTKLLPFMLAAVGEWKNQIDQIAIIYQLLREDPHSIFQT